VNVIADIVGWYSDGSNFAANQSAAGFVGAVPTRILDTRNGTGVPGGSHNPVSAQGTLTLDVVSVVPVNHDPTATAVVLNVTATAPTKNGWLTVFPADQPRPTASNLNFVAGQTVANLVVVKLGQGGGNAGKVKINNTGGNGNARTVHVIADVVGYYKRPGLSATNLTPFAPQRILDTRDGTGVPGGSHAPVGPNAAITVNPQNATGVPAVGAYSGVIVNVTVTGPTKSGWLTVYPSDQTIPNASNLNFKAGQTVPNLVQVKVGADGRFKITNTGVPGNPQPSSGSVHVVVNIVGYFQ
jgi:hypothetical protein